MRQKIFGFIMVSMIAFLIFDAFVNPSRANLENDQYLPLISNPPNPPPENIFIVANVTGYRDQDGYLYVIGLVTNKASFAVSGVKVKIEIFDSAGILLHVDTTNPSLYTLASGETSPFSIWIFEDLPNADSYAASISDYKITTVQRGTINIDSIICLVDDHGDPHATGRLINNTDIPININGLAAATFDENGDLYTADAQSVIVRYLDPGETGPFRVTMNGPVDGSPEIYTCEIYIDSVVTAPLERFGLTFSETHHIYLDNFQNFHMVGEVTNNHDEHLSLVLVSGIYDQNGNVMDAATTDIPTFSIAPGETLPYDFQYWGPLNYKTGTYETISNYTVQTDPYWTWVSSIEYVEITTQNDSYLVGPSLISFNGEVLNDSGSEVEGATVIVRLFDNSSGQIIATGYGGIYDPIAPNETAEYLVWIKTPLDFDIASINIEITAKGELP